MEKAHIDPKAAGAAGTAQQVNCCASRAPLLQYAGQGLCSPYRNLPPEIPHVRKIKSGISGGLTAGILYPPDMKLPRPCARKVPTRARPGGALAPAKIARARNGTTRPLNHSYLK